MTRTGGPYQMKRDLSPVLETVRSIIDSYRTTGIGLLGLPDYDVELNRVEYMAPSYGRTVIDIVTAFEQPDGINILEVGSYLGVVSRALRKLGFLVTAQDLPEFQKAERLQRLYRKEDICFTSVNLSEGKLPYATASFMVIMPRSSNTSVSIRCRSCRKSTGC